MSPIAEAKPVHARWSEVNREFLEHVERHPAYLDRATFASLGENPALRKLSFQPWPLFFGPEQRREVEALTLGMDRLIKGAIERFLAGDPARVIDFYRTRTLDEASGETGMVIELNEEVLGILLQEPTGIRSALSRADYIETRDGLKCIEYNAGGFLGGIQTQAIGELYLDSPPTVDFLRERGLAARAPDTLGAFFRHLVEDTARAGIWAGGEFNVAIFALPHEEAQLSMHFVDQYERELRGVLEAMGAGPEGRVFLCGAQDFVEEGERLLVEGRPVHAVFEQHDGTGDGRLLYWYHKQRRLNMFSGPITPLLCDKRNLALISEHADSDEFTAEERELIEKHVPWTRRVLPARTPFRGREVSLPDDLLERREEFVLKKATGLGGTQVHPGRFRTDEEWRRLVSRAVREEDWVVQEFLETVPYCFQSGETGVARHDMVWGLFAFGDHFGGAFLRMQPVGGGGGVVNTRQGAEVGVVLELA